MKFAGITEDKCCEGKKRFLTRDEASKRLSPRRRKEVHPYHCQLCGYWHNGGNRLGGKAAALKNEKKRRILDKEKSSGMEY